MLAAEAAIAAGNAVSVSMFFYEISADTSSGQASEDLLPSTRTIILASGPPRSPGVAQLAVRVLVGRS